MSKDNDQIAAASDLGKPTQIFGLPVVQLDFSKIENDATRTLERVKALLVEALKESAPGRPGWGQTYAAWQEIEALEARREAGRDGA